MFLKDLCELPGVSGQEKQVRDYISAHIQDFVEECVTDKMGNLLTLKKGTSGRGPRIALCAHMDEVGLFITEITAEGYLKFQPVGGIDPRILVAKPLLSSSGTGGVIGAKAIHLQKPEERKQNWKIEELYIDIGANSKEEAEKLVKLGDCFTFPTRFEPLGPDLWKAKAFDDRAGCALIMDLLQGNYPSDLLAAFTVQEEVGLRGSRVLGNYLQADLALVIEATMAADIQDTAKEEWSVELGKGPAVSLMDAATIYNPELRKKVVGLAGRLKIPVQFRRSAAAANDAGNIHQAGAGIPTLTLSIPCRNIHSMSSIIARSDYENCLKLLQAILINAELFFPLMKSFY